ncbi:AAA family ATPase [Blastococcus sp. MG754426]|uniref:AAA family ATPase n=1 Tax=unclassified Blastococcus TaxID=2619396 RepID=UPI001EF0DCE3|nr:MULTISPECIES: ATP-binding protein [unclassified Blastococcus]MCF6506115.1 AAA family ATPase [Blastococcus sp. MG754426]MCF6510507.1 AAA family ATPase [Blastococcus sp. MG754427]
MAGRHLKELFRAFRMNDELAFRRAATEIIEEEEGKHHFALARDLQRLMAGGSSAGLDVGSYAVLPEPPKDREGDWALAEVRTPERTLDELVVSPRVTATLRDIGTEVPLWAELDQHAVPRRQRFLFQGPPGCGKTSAAEALAHELRRPFVVVRLDAVVSSYLGETASNLRRVLDYANQAPFVLLFDEFDALGRTRDDAAEHGEMKRVVTAFLQMIDKYRGPSILIAATNHPALLDAALWRRFDEVIDFGKPSVHELRRLIRLRLRPVPHKGVDVERYASALKGLPHAAAEKLVWDARRFALMSQRKEVTSDDMDGALSRVTARPW